MTKAEKFCRCIKAVRRTVKLRSGPNTRKSRERAAIAICTKSMLQTKGRTLKKFKCRTPNKKAYLKTQRM